MTKSKKKVDITALIEELEGQLEQKALDEWPVRALQEFKKSGTRVSLTKRGNWTQSRIRAGNPSKWSVEELLDWIEGRIECHRSTRPESIWSVVYARWGVPNNYIYEDAKAFILEHTLPATTLNGFLVQDRRRSEADILDLTYPELCLMYLKKVETRFTESQLKRRIMTIARIVTDYHFDELIENFEKGVVNMSGLTDQIIGAFDARKELYRKYGKRVSDEQLAVNTKAIYNSLRRVMKADYADFGETWRVILKYVDTHYNTLFHPSQIRRGWPQLDLTGGNLYVLDRILTLITGTRNPATRRDDIRFYKLDYILEHISNAKERENIIAFYTEQ